MQRLIFWYQQEQVSLRAQWCHNDLPRCNAAAAPCTSNDVSHRAPRIIRTTRCIRQWATYVRAPRDLLALNQWRLYAAGDMPGELWNFRSSISWTYWRILVHVDYYLPRERQFQGTKVPGSESYWNFRSRQRKFLGAKVPVTKLATSNMLFCK